MRWKRARFMKPSVAGVCGTVRMTKSARGSSVSSASGLCSSATPGGDETCAVHRSPARSCRTPRQAVQSPRRCRPHRRSARWLPADARRRGSRAGFFHSRRSCCGIYTCRPRANASTKAMMCALMWSLKISRKLVTVSECCDQLGIVVSGSRRGLRRLQPAQPLRLRQQVARQPAERRLGIDDLALGRRLHPRR